MRVIRKNASTSGREAVELLSSLFAMEVLSPSRCIWVISPWVSDIPLLDNRFGGFPTLDEVGQRVLTLSEVLVALADRGSYVVVATRPDSSNQRFVSQLTLLATSAGLMDRMTITVVERDQRLHDKSLAGDNYVVAGSMNFTTSGTLLNEEQVQLHTDPAYVAQTQTDLYQRFGGDLG